MQMQEQILKRFWYYHLSRQKKKIYYSFIKENLFRMFPEHSEGFLLFFNYLEKIYLCDEKRNLYFQL
jgi:hypothetical protein